ncbi:MULTISPECIES: SulP family inorganic anion transporter [unclassified Paenibacillus]|uniref:SulP family inorganic anion transporter n=1 Tax=unclassified Paenibacillus TaxID=185978 RepID=UPI001AE4C703|nr:MULTISPECIES: SulP family inorganic anion transporter [unclassified Paenibacillus]MBP1157290.1 SulP family sulfate permease [Paenibacillus sp. PvP091]MBP1171971.1 SulP family sulfate permease [Paenibacillus sp. PvR098]MBP2438352.1 SulP family sulfate permease [Paenibacillus sp. PvP052]
MQRMGRFKGYTLTAFRNDMISGLIVGVIAIPLGMAFAIASGVKPEYGIYTTIVAGICISLFGGSKYQIGGPTGAFIPVLFAIVMEYGYENLLIAGFMAGVLLVLMGICRLGILIRYIPRPVTIGFTAGIAMIIFSGQIASFLGLQDIEKHEDFLSNMKEIAAHLSTFDGYSILTAFICLGVILLTSRYTPKIPGSLIGLILSSAAAILFFDGKVPTIGSAFGAIPDSLPHFQFPQLTWERIEMLLGPALIIAMLGGIESLLSAVVADEMTGSRHNSNRELVGQGIANIVTPLFGGIPATGAIARTATNIKNGAVSPMSGIIHGLTVLGVLLLFAPFASRIPLASMAPILMIVAWNMSERKAFAHILKMKSSDTLILLVTFILTVLTTLTTAVGLGLLLAILLFLKQMGDTTSITKVLPGYSSKRGKKKLHRTKRPDCPQMNIYHVEGPLFFGMAHALEKSIPGILQSKKKILLFEMGKVPFMDVTGAADFGRLIIHVRQSGGVVLLSGAGGQLVSTLEKTGLLYDIGREHLFNRMGEAVAFALTQMDSSRCAGCKQFAFRECAALSNVEAGRVTTASGAED